MHPNLRTVITGAAVVFATGSWFLLAQAQPQQRGRADDDSRVVEALRHGGLRAAAAVRGSYVQVLSGSLDNEPSQMTSLTNDSELVVVGQVLNHRFWLDAPGRTVLTNYEVSVERVFKGTAPLGGLITVTMPGGRVSFPDGTWAETRVGGAPPLVNGNRCLFFLAPTRYKLTSAQRAEAHDGGRRSANSAGRGGVNYSPVRSVFGYYPLRPDGVWPVSRLKSPLRTKYEGKSESLLFADVQSAIGK
jgi:hypothetical protein